MVVAPPRFVPKALMRRPAEFGQDPEAEWRAARNLTEASLMAHAYWQHLAACVINERLRDSGASRKELAQALGVGTRMLGSKLNGTFPAASDELFRWALAFNDVSILPPPVNRVADVLPKARGKHSYKRLGLHF
jgi:hypothetical protein